MISLLPESIKERGRKMKKETRNEENNVKYLELLPVEEIVRYVENKRHHRVWDVREPGNDERQG